MHLYELQIVRRADAKEIGTATKSEVFRITDIKDIFPLAREIRVHDQEHVLIVTLDPDRRVLSSRIVHIGAASECCVSLRDVFRGAIIDNATAMIFIHNHPGEGFTLRMSKSDKKMLKCLLKGARHLDIEIVDFVIVSSHGLYSCAKQKKMKVN